MFVNISLWQETRTECELGSEKNGLRCFSAVDIIDKFFSRLLGGGKNKDRIQRVLNLWMICSFVQVLKNTIRVN